VSLPVSERELFFDIEVDPMRDHCYLHGFVERIGGNNGTERFISFFADQDSEEAEREAFAGAWRYMRSIRTLLRCPLDEGRPELPQLVREHVGDLDRRATV
jgi:predicted RecB family nuclease